MNAYERRVAVRKQKASVRLDAVKSAIDEALAATTPATEGKPK